MMKPQGGVLPGGCARAPGPSEVAQLWVRLHCGPRPPHLMPLGHSSQLGSVHPAFLSPDFPLPTLLPCHHAGLGRLNMWKEA